VTVWFFAGCRARTANRIEADAHQTDTVPAAMSSLGYSKLFRLLGYRFSPRLADIGGTRFWRIDPNADYGKLNVISQHRLRPQRISPHWAAILRLNSLGSVRKVLEHAER
jgi:TnpA family transposase